MKRAIISDIHSNLEALEAVLEDIHQQGISEVYCLGKGSTFRPQGPTASNRFFLAMAYGQLGRHDVARERYEDAIQWWQKQTNLSESSRRELEAIRTEADATLGRQVE